MYILYIFTSFADALKTERKSWLSLRPQVLRKAHGLASPVTPGPDSFWNAQTVA
ncbi:Uncharacterized protein FKW44_001600 [Caligus rogercresseyi]|uniref:Uncharacterized protein n=1 Tax=Caligus rogercresseyi TaxID=217165 RepID=A0A7T8QVP3_CALRO|nr:Uncharacterized protein FKW44_001600 [Caligus rogercresseyi]